MKRIISKINNLFKITGYFLFSFFKRIRLRNKNFTIFCNNCIGGCVYHLLGQKFLSPTINCYMNTNNFLKFLLNFEFYLDKSLVFKRDKNDNIIGIIDDIEVVFNHASSEEKAAQEWNRRKERINKDNLYAIIRELDYYETLPNEIILSLTKKYKNIVIITFDKRKKKAPFYKYINLSGGKDEFTKNYFRIDLWARKWDFVRFLNKKRIK